MAARRNARGGNRVTRGRKRPKSRTAKRKNNKKRAASKNSANDDNMGVVLRKGGKPKGLSSKKRIKITPDFKKGVMKALEGKRAIGYMRELSNVKFGFAIGDNLQEIGYLNDSSGTTSLYGLFSPVRVMDAAACLFNNKTVAESKVSVTGNYPTLNTKINVLKQWVTFDIINQSRLKRHITFYVATQKGRKNAASATNDPLLAWDKALSLDAQDLPDADYPGPNLQNVLKSFLYQKPNMSKAWNKEYTTTATEVLIEPGQSYKFSVQGPTGEYDYNNYHIADATAISELSPMTKFCFYTVYNELCETSLGVTGRFETAVVPANTPNGLIVEHSYNYRIEAPQTAGLKIGGTATNTTHSLNLVRDAYIFKNYGVGAGLGQINRIDDNDPTVPMQQD